MLRVDFAAHECKTAAAVCSLGSAEMKLSVAGKSVFSRALGEGEVDKPVDQNARLNTVAFVFTIVSYPISIICRETLDWDNQQRVV